MKKNETVAIFLHDEPDGDATYLSFRKPVATVGFDSVVHEHIEEAREKAGTGDRDAAWVDRFVCAMEGRGYTMISSDFAWAMNGKRTSMLGCHVPDDYKASTHQR